MHSALAGCGCQDAMCCGMLALASKAHYHGQCTGSGLGEAMAPEAWLWPTAEGQMCAWQLHSLTAATICMGPSSDDPNGLPSAAGAILDMISSRVAAVRPGSAMVHIAPATWAIQCAWPTDAAAHLANGAIGSNVQVRARLVKGDVHRVFQCSRSGRPAIACVANRASSCHQNHVIWVRHVQLPHPLAFEVGVVQHVVLVKGQASEIDGLPWRTQARDTSATRAVARQRADDVWCGADVVGSAERWWWRSAAEWSMHTS